jgi:hypothetical protein
MAHTMSVLGIDIAKLVFHVVGMDDTGHVVLRKRIARSELLPFIANLPPTLHRDGRVWECPLLGPAFPRAWP